MCGFRGGGGGGGGGGTGVLDPIWKITSSIGGTGPPSHSRGAQWLSGRVLDSRPMGRWLEPHRHHCVVSLSKNINPSLVLV